MNLKWIGIALVASASIGLAQAQTEKTSTPKFEVISVKLNKTPDPNKGSLQLLPGGRFVATNIPLIRVIAVAWNLPLQSQRLTLASGVSMPDDIYDMEATPADDTFPPEMTQEARLTKMRLMLQALLEDRFQLRVRVEPKEEPVYVLVVGKGGPKFEKSKFQEEKCGDTSPNWINNPACHFLDGGQDSGLHGGSVTMAQVVEGVSNLTDRPVLNETNLTGYWNIETEGWAPMRPTLDGARQRGDATANDSDRPSLFDVFEKLGLQMESQRAVIDVFVIDHVEKPTEN